MSDATSSSSFPEKTKWLASGLVAPGKHSFRVSSRSLGAL